MAQGKILVGSKLIQGLRLSLQNVISFLRFIAFLILHFVHFHLGDIIDELLLEIV